MSEGKISFVFLIPVYEFICKFLHIITKSIILEIEKIERSDAYEKRR